MKNTRTYHSADCDTDHSLILSGIKVEPKKLHTAKNTGMPRLNINNTKDPTKAQQFRDIIEQSLDTIKADDSVDVAWCTMKSVLHKAALDCFGKKTSRNKDWFDVYSEELIPIIEAKNQAHTEHNHKQTTESKQNLKTAKKDVQKKARYFANLHWLNLCSSIQEASDMGNIRGMYDGIKKALGPTIKKVAPLKSKEGVTITDKSKQMERWVEHYLELYSKVSNVAKDAIDSLPQYPIMSELDDEPDLLELSKALDAMANGKAAGSD